MSKGPLVYVCDPLTHVHGLQLIIRISSTYRLCAPLEFSAVGPKCNVISVIFSGVRLSFSRPMAKTFSDPRNM